MSIKDLFNKDNQSLKISNKSFANLVTGSEIESAKQVEAYYKDADKTKVPVDYSDPSSFARYGSAKKYYGDSIKYIYETYPYDGSSYEKIAWAHSSSMLDNWMFKNKYPRTTGYAILSPTDPAVYSGPATGPTPNSNDYAKPKTDEYITLFGGPHKDPKHTKLSDMFAAQGGTANIYSTGSNRDSNLEFNLSSSGATVEFWLKKNNEAILRKEVIFDMWNQTTAAAGGIPRENYGRFLIELTGTKGPFLVTVNSGGVGVKKARLGSGLALADVTGDKWRHYAITVQSASAGTLEINLYRNGTVVDSVLTGSAIGPVTGSWRGQIGALNTIVSGGISSGSSIDLRGWGKLSGSVDEFRYWKTKRSAKQIGINWFTQVYGGTNTDSANKYLGVYYKFNEGITLTSSTDSKVLDYSGRISNGTWTGYSTTSRNTGSAIDNAGYSEFKDPIIYSYHPDVVSVKTSYEQSGYAHDVNNTARMEAMIPGWIIEDDEKSGNPLLRDLLQVMGNYFDELSNYIEYLPKMRDRNYISSSTKPLPFASHYLDSSGFKYDELFSVASALEDIYDKSEHRKLTDKVQNVKNLIYTNIYSNLIHLNKAKGTSRSIRNLLNCIGVDEDLIKVNTYANNEVYEIRENTLNTSQYSRLADFTHTQRQAATIFQYSGSTNNITFITGSTTEYKEMEGLGFTAEAEIMFPEKPDVGTSEFNNFDFPHITSSMFGMHTAKIGAPADLTWATNDYANFQVYAIRDDVYSKTVKFVLTSSHASAIPLLSSSFFKDVYDNSKWNLAVRVSPIKYPYTTVPAETSASNGSDKYKVELYGVNYIGGYKNQEFVVSSSVSRTNIKKFMSYPKRMYIGAHRTNFTGTVAQKSDVRYKSFRTWLDRIPNEAIRAHAKDTENFGTLTPYRNTALFNKTLQSASFPQIATLALQWRFDNLTGSDAKGEFLVSDYSSGSTALQSRYGWISKLAGAYYNGLGYGFPSGSTGSIDVDWIYRQKQLPFEQINDDNDVTIFSGSDDTLFMRDSRPVDYMYSIEKSMYQSISDEMINFFATIKDFNNLVGQPVNRYRQEYKDMGKLRELFFERVQNTPDLDKYVNYYKWFDHAVGKMVENLVPASARFNSDVNVVVESHALERNKYWNKFPTIDAKVPEPEAVMKGSEELHYNWKFGHAPVGYSDKWAVSFVSASVSANTQTVRVADADSLSFGNGSTDSPFSYTFWIRFDNWTSWPAEGTMLRKNSEYNFYVTAAKQAEFRLRDYSAGAAYQYAKVSPAVFGAAIKHQTWHHVACTYDGRGGASANAGMKIYVDGVDLTTNRASAGSYTAMENKANPLYFMSSVGTQDNLSGKLDEVGLWTKALGSGEIAQVYNSGFPTDLTKVSAASSLSSYWKMGDGDAITASGILDSKGSNNGTPLNSPTIVPRGVLGLGINDADRNCLWWKDRAERTVPALSSSNSDVNSDKQELLVAITTEVTGSTYARRSLSRPYRLSVDRLNSFGEQSKRYENKKDIFYRMATSYGPPGKAGQQFLTALTTSFKAFPVCKDAPTPPELVKKKWSYKVQFATGSTNNPSGKGDMFFPFTLFSSSVNTGYASVFSQGNRIMAFNNMHQDTYENMPAPIQSPFTEKWVGGSQNRHVKLNFSSSTKKGPGGLDDAYHRPEAWSIANLGTGIQLLAPISSSKNGLPPQARYYRDEIAKRPVNIANIVMTGASPTQIGNYSQRYEYFQTSGRNINNLWWLSGTTGQGGWSQATAQSDAISGVIDFELPDRSTLSNGQKNKTVFASKFSAPGGPEVMSRGYLDTYSETLSVYNALPWRNSIVRNALNTWSTHHMLFGGYDATYGAPTASYFKVNKNRRFRIELNGTTYITGSRYDNAWVQHPIPQSDRNYSWITSSITGAGVNFGQMGPLGYAPASGLYRESSSIGQLAERNAYNWVTSSENPSTIIKSGLGLPQWRLWGAKWGATFWRSAPNQTLVYTSFNGMSYHVRDPVSASLNMLGYPFGKVTDMSGSNLTWGYNGENKNCYRNITFVKDSVERNLSNGWMFNSLILNRGGLYGWPSWKQIRGAEHPIVRQQRTENVLSIVTSSKGIQNSVPPQPPIKTLQHFTESAVTINRPMRLRLDLKDGLFGENNDITLTIAYSNQKQYFLNWQLGRYALGQKTTSTSATWDPAKTTTAYDNFKWLYSPNAGVFMPPESQNPVNGFIHLDYNEIIFPRKKNAFLKNAFSRPKYYVNFWRNGRTQRKLTNFTNSAGKKAHFESMWPLDGRQNFATAPAYAFYAWSSNTRPTGASGELLNQYSIYRNNIGTSGSSLYSRPIEEAASITGLRFVAGDAKWEAAEQAGAMAGQNTGSLQGPTWETYDEYSQDLKFIGKGYSVVPEFRMSQHMPYYVDTQGGNFLAENPSFLTLTGAAVPSTKDNPSKFFLDYSTTDFLKYVANLREDHQGFARANKITLECKALMKFLPYDGFYPADRCRQLTTLFSQSYKESIELEGAQASIRTVLTPLFAPGILFNSIKSGIAVDYPIYTSNITVNNRVNAVAGGIPSLTKAFDQRMPFEAIVSPESHFAGIKIHDAEPHPSASLVSTGSLAGKGSKLYSYAAHNFMAEVPRLFLEDSAFTTFKSKSDAENFTPEQAGSLEYVGTAQGHAIGDPVPKEYRMRLVVSNAKFQTRKELSNALMKNGSGIAVYSASWAVNPPVIQTYRRFPSDPVSRTATGQTYGNKIPALNMRHGSSFGPPVNAENTVYCANQNNSTPTAGESHEYSAFTPPYYDGYSEVEFVFRPPNSTDPVSFDEVRQGLSVEYRRVCTGGRVLNSNDVVPQNASKDMSSNSAMNISASFNLNQFVSVKQTTTDAAGNPITVAAPEATIKQWVIQPKWECPILNFETARVTLPAQGSGSTPLGLWHQYGRVPSRDAGVWASLYSPSTDEYTKPEHTGSLATLLGFQTEPERLGRVAQTKTVREAVVAIPYVLSNNEMRFYGYDRDIWNCAVWNQECEDAPAFPGKSMVAQAKAMSRYVFPPRFDCYNNKAIQPMAMYIFEFEHKFNQLDLANIWQNLPPQSLTRIAEPKNSTATIEHELLPNEIFGHTGNGDLISMNNNTRWLVFKVKQRAEKNYYNMTFDVKDGDDLYPGWDPSNPKGTLGFTPAYSYNWPYDYFSMVELAQINAGVQITPGALDMSAYGGMQKWDTLGQANPAKSLLPGPTMSDAKFKTPIPPPPTQTEHPVLNPPVGGSKPPNPVPPKDI